MDTSRLSGWTCRNNFKMDRLADIDFGKHQQYGNNETAVKTDGSVNTMAGASVTELRCFRSPDCGIPCNPFTTKTITVQQQ
jgi:hypothetical protein